MVLFEVVGVLGSPELLCGFFTDLIMGGNVVDAFLDQVVGQEIAWVFRFQGRLETLNVLFFKHLGLLEFQFSHCLVKLSLLVGKSLDIVFYLIVPVLDIDFVLLVFVEVEVLSVYGVLLEFLCGVCGLPKSFAFNVLL